MTIWQQLVYYDKQLIAFLIAKFPSVKIEKLKGSKVRNWYRLDSGCFLYVIGSKIHSYGGTWSDLHTDDFTSITDNSKECYCALVIESPKTTLVLPPDVMANLFDDRSLLSTTMKGPKWEFGIFPRPTGYFLHFNKGGLEKPISSDYLNDWDQIPDFAGITVRKLSLTSIDIEKAIVSHNIKVVEKVLTSEKLANTKRRIGQDAVRRLTLANYSNQCAACDIKEPDLLIASHIAPWSKDVINRGVLENIICFCALHDRLFEKGKMIVDHLTNEIKFSESFRNLSHSSKTYEAYKTATYSKLRLPTSFSPDPLLLKKHREQFPTVKYT